MGRTHLTDSCEHAEKENEKPLWCKHCEEGCQSCGKLEDLDDDMYCLDCAESRAQYAADCIYESMKEGD